MKEALKRLLGAILLTFRSIILLHRAILSGWNMHENQLQAVEGRQLPARFDGGARIKNHLKPRN